MTARPPTCPGCRGDLPADPALLSGLRGCPACGRRLEVAVLPGFDRPAPSGPMPRPAVAAGEARCYFHASRQAENPCDGCGRYLCALCDVPVGARHLCPECLAADRRNPAGAAEPDRIRWDRIAWGCLLGSLLLCWPTLVAIGPAVVLLAIARARSAPSRVAASRRGLLTAAVAGGALAAGAAMTAAWMYGTWLGP